MFTCQPLAQKTAHFQRKHELLLFFITILAKTLQVFCNKYYSE